MVRAGDAEQHSWVGTGLDVQGGIKKNKKLEDLRHRARSAGWGTAVRDTQHHNPWAGKSFGAGGWE